MNLESHWYRSSYSWLTFLLLPLSWLFYSIVMLRYFLYRFKIKKTFYFPVPVIVVGNIAVGGTGKTPFVIWLAQLLQKEGYRPAIVCRGFGGKRQSTPYWVGENSDPALIGDESVLLARRVNCPVVICVDRVAAVKQLLEKTNCNVVISDDGLQHYRLGRDVEVAIVDAQRQFGNGCLLPAGPLREPRSRLRHVDFTVVNGVNMQLDGSTLISLQDKNKTLSLQKLRGQTVHAVAGIGNPERFFSLLREHQVHVVPHVFPDHYLFEKKDIYFNDQLPVIMTEKDAVKCDGFAGEQHWYFPVDAKVADWLGESICGIVEKKLSG